MPHLVILYTGNLKREINMSSLCRALATEMMALCDESGAPVFPTGGTRVLAYPAEHYAVADGREDYGFVYLNLRMGAGRSSAIKQLAGDALSAIVRAQFATILATRFVGITLQIDESPGQVYDAKLGNLHPLFTR